MIKPGTKFKRIRTEKKEVRENILEYIDTDKKVHSFLKSQGHVIFIEESVFKKMLNDKGYMVKDVNLKLIEIDPEN